MTEKLRLDIPILLPDLSNAADACVARLISEMRSREGVEQVHVAATGPHVPAQLCVHYDPAIVTLPRIRELVARAGAEITERFGHILWQVEAATSIRESISNFLRRMLSIASRSV